ncbi:MAG: SDR family oxidoreductase [Erythrobacter sp.]|uniref:SDR family NAD(P)-dependent oxidoreductase n=1 Tax=Erythrobacter sp. TaxID=1042 RepID=UPI0025F2E6BF|nr:SDR family oxidoreductase [Erythrobacter sp.]MCL9999047.1 SDR family oxidoreductase [Erythrobacter sp.]
MAGSAQRRGIVVGGAGGIGRAIVAAARALGDDVLVMDRAPAASGDIACDQADPASVAAAFAEADRRFSGAAPDWMVAAASISRRHDLLTATCEEMQTLFAVNVLGTAMLAQQAARRMRCAGRGHIVVITSIAAAQAWAQEAFYGVTKAAQAALVQGLAVELGPLGIAVNAVGPGAVAVASRGMVATRDDPDAMAGIIARTPAGRLGTPEEIAEAVLFLTRSGWITGQTLYVDGGYLAAGMMAPPDD